MNPKDQNYGAGADAARQADSIQKQMAAEAEAALPKAPEVDNSILADFGDDLKPLSDIVHADPNPAANTTVTPPTQTTESFVRKEKKPFNKKLIFIIGGVILGAALLALIVWLIVGVIIPSISADDGGAKATPDHIGFFIEDDNGGLVAVYNEAGERLSDFKYKKVSDFNSKGYAIVENTAQDSYAIVANTGKLSVPYQKYDNISEFGAYFIVEEDSDSYIIDGSGEKISITEYYEKRYGLYLNYDGTTATIYDKYGEVVGKSSDKHALSSTYVKGSIVCAQDGAKVNCYNTKTSERILTADSPEFANRNIGIWSISKNNNCAVLHDKDTYEEFTYYNDTIKGMGYMPGLIVADRPGWAGCYFVMGNESIISRDGVIMEKADFNHGNFTKMAVIDSTRYAYALTGEDNKTAVVRIGDKTRELTAEKEIQVGGGMNYFTVAVDHILYFFKDSIEPYYQVEIASPTAGIIPGVYITSDIDENGFVIVDKTLYSKDGKLVQEFDGIGTIEHIDGLYYYYRSRTGAPYTAVIGKDGKMIEDEGAYAELSPAGEYILAKDNDGAYDLLDKSGKEVLSDYDGIDIFDSHIEAHKDSHTEYYKLDLTKIK